MSQYTDTSESTKAWAVSQHNDTSKNTKALGCHNTLTPALSSSVNDHRPLLSFLVHAGLFFVSVVHRTWTTGSFTCYVIFLHVYTRGKNTKAWSVSQYTDNSKNTKAWAVSQHTKTWAVSQYIDTSKNTKAWAVSQYIDTSKNTKAWAVS